MRGLIALIGIGGILAVTGLLVGLGALLPDGLMAITVGAVVGLGFVFHLLSRGHAPDFALWAIVVSMFGSLLAFAAGWFCVFAVGGTLMGPAAVYFNLSLAIVGGSIASTFLIDWGSEDEQYETPSTEAAR